MRPTALLTLILLVCLPTTALAQKLKYTYLVIPVGNTAMSQFHSQQLLDAINEKLKELYANHPVEVRDWAQTGCKAAADPAQCDVIELKQNERTFSLTVEMFKPSGPAKHGNVRELGDFKCANSQESQCWEDAVRDSAAVVSRHHRDHAAVVTK